MANDRNYRTMGEFDAMRWGLIVATMVSIFVVSIAFTIFGNAWFGFTAFCALTIWFVAASIYTFPSDPPTKWIPLVMGDYVEGKLMWWGPTLLPWRSSLTIDAAPLPGGIMHVDLEPKEMIPADRVTVVIPVHLFYEVDERNAVQVIRLGGVAKAAELLQEYVGKALRQWITHPEKGPEKTGDAKQTLDWVRGMTNEATNHLLEELAKDDVSVVHSDIPIEALMGIFTGRQLWPREEKWKKEVEALSDREREDLRAKVMERMDDIKAIREGTRKPITITSAGLMIRQMVVENIEPDGPSAAYAAKVAEAHFGKEVKLIEAKALAEQAAIIKPGTTAMDPTQAALILQGKIEQKINVTKLDASDPVVKMMSGLGGALIGAILNRKIGREVANGNDTNKPNANTGNGQ